MTQKWNLKVWTVEGNLVSKRVFYYLFIIKNLRLTYYPICIQKERKSIAQL